MSALECQGVSVAYGTVPVLEDVHLTVAAGEAAALLGPSGSGKTTLLYAVAGFVDLRLGEIRIGGRRAAWAGGGLAPEERSVGMVFQNYALWPHLTALETVAYPFRRRGADSGEARRRAAELLERMGIGDLAARRPAELSGGQQQRVGLARALARAAGLYLFDEPTAHLDAALRAAVQREMAERQRRTGAAALYATHDATEALAVADRVALLRSGGIIQLGTPEEIYDRPVDLWAARLTGPASILETWAEGRSGDKVAVRVGEETVSVRGPGDTPPGRARLLVRPDWAALGGGLGGLVRQVWYRGPHTDYRLDTPVGALDVRMPGTPQAASGERVTWSLDRVWPVEA